jgi:hypothetical protein
MGTESAVFRVRGEYLESCNCEAICPCRMVGGIPGGRSTYGICFGLLTWKIEDGVVDNVEVGGLNVALDVYYDDDEEGSPWSIRLHLDARANHDQHAALARLFLDGLGGPQTSKLPWIRKARHLISVETAEIELAPGEARVGDAIRLRATRPVEADEPVACGIPGYDQPGRELYADELLGPGYELHGNCAFASRFDYRSG